MSMSRFFFTVHSVVSVPVFVSFFLSSSVVHGQVPSTICVSAPHRLSCNQRAGKFLEENGPPDSNGDTDRWLRKTGGINFFRSYTQCWEFAQYVCFKSLVGKCRECSYDHPVVYDHPAIPQVIPSHHHHTILVTILERVRDPRDYSPTQQALVALVAGPSPLIHWRSLVDWVYRTWNDTYWAVFSPVWRWKANNEVCQPLPVCARTESLSAASLLHRYQLTPNNIFKIISTLNS